MNIIIFCKTLYDRNKQKNLILVNVENPLPEEYSVDLSEITEEVMVAVPGCAAHDRADAGLSSARELAADFNAAYYGFYFLEFADYYCQENNDETEMLKLLYQTLRALESPAFSNRLVRCIYELRTLTINGEAPNVFGCTKCGKKEALHWFSGKTARMLCDHCVNELRRKPENMAALPTYQKVQESTVYTMQYIMTAKLAKLYTFSVSDQVLWELQQCIREYMKYYINHSFKSLKILEEVENMI